MLDPPSKLKNLAPASSAMIFSGAKSQGLPLVSIHKSACPRATIIASRHPPMLRTAQNWDTQSSNRSEKPYWRTVENWFTQSTAWDGSEMFDALIGWPFTNAPAPRDAVNISSMAGMYDAPATTSPASSNP